MTAILRPTGDYRTGVLRRALLVVVGLAVAVAAAVSTATSRSAVAGLPPAEHRLDLVAFPGYAEAGGDDPRVNWVQPFVQKTGCKVHVRTVRSSTELLDVVDQGTYDGVAAFGDVTQVLTGGKEVQPIDTDLIPAYDDVYPALKTLPQNLEHGRIVGIPHGRGADLLLWRTDLVHPAPKSWDVLYDPRYAGRIGLRDEAITLAQTAIHLGYRNPYELGKAQFRKVVRAAAEQSASVGAYWQDLVTALADFTGGNAIVGAVSARQATLLRADQVPVATAVTPGGTAHSASWMILSHARHPGCMYRWLDYILTGKPNAKSARYLGEAPATSAACAYMSCKGVHADDPAWWSRLSFVRTPQHDCHDARGEACVDWFGWSDAWALIRAG
jgi:putative spermidine/putrescine transport system substrate-binding protein